MKKTDRNNMPDEVRGMFDSIHAIVKFSRWTYECAIEEGFTPNQALELAKAHIHATMNAASAMGGKKP